MPVIKGFDQTYAVAQRPKHYQNVHNLMTSSKDVKSSRVPAFWNPNAVNCCTDKIENTETDEVVNAHPPILQFPAI